MSYKIVSTKSFQIYDSFGNLLGYPPHTYVTTVAETNQDFYAIPPSTANKVIPLVNAGCQLLTIYTDNMISVSVNGDATPINITDEYTIVSDAINSLTISNPSLTLTANIKVLVGNNI
jgi:hypothetical protein